MGSPALFRKSRMGRNREERLSRGNKLAPRNARIWIRAEGWTHGRAERPVAHPISGPPGKITLTLGRHPAGPDGATSQSPR